VTYVFRAARLLLLLLAVAFLVMPVVVAVSTSFGTSATIEFPPRGFSLEWYRIFFTSPDWMQALRVSAQVALASTVLAVVAGTCLALAAARGSVLPSGLLAALAMTPLIVPIVVVAVGSYIVFVRVGLTGSILGLSLAEGALGIPFVFINVASSLTQMPPSIEDAARGLGANGFHVFRRVTLPNIMPGILIGGLLALVSAWDEIVVASFLSSPYTETLPVLFWGEVRYGLQPVIGAAASFIIGVSVLTYAVALLARSLSRILHRRTISLAGRQ
jgi:putative spermidine/putrescine transport system permease protein